MNEEWKDIIGFEGLYKVSNFGNVLSVSSGRNLKLGMHSKGYHQINLCKDGKKKTKFVHRLVVEAFIGSDDRIVNHKDAVRTNNNISNLEYVNRREHTTHANGERMTGALKRKGKDFWYSSIRLDGKLCHLGHFSTAEEASAAYHRVLKFMGLENKYAR